MEEEEYERSREVERERDAIAQVSELQAAALACVERGWYVFPVSDAPPAPNSASPSRAKHPTAPMRRARGSLARLREPWNTLATNDREQVRFWWAEWPTALVGVATGPRSRLLVLHMDADDTFIRQLLPELPLTVTAQADGVTDYYFQMPATDAPIKDQTGYLPNGVHVRGEGQYVLAPPSLESADNPYSWLRAPGDAPLAPLPVSVRNSILKRVDIVATAAETAHIAEVQDTLLPSAVEQVMSGEKKARDAAFWLAQRLQSVGLDRIRGATSVMYEFVARLPQSTGHGRFTQSDADSALKLVYPGVSTKRRRAH